MIQASDFDELVFTCTDMLLHNPKKLVDELVRSVEEDTYYAAVTSFAVLHASIDLCLPQEHVSTFFGAVSSLCSADNVSECTRHLAEIESSYYAGYMDDYQGMPVFQSNNTLH